MATGKYEPAMQYWAGYIPQVGDLVRVKGDAEFMRDVETWRVTDVAPNVQQARIESTAREGRPSVTVVHWNTLEHIPAAETQERDKAMESLRIEIRRLKESITDRQSAHEDEIERFKGTIATRDQQIMQLRKINETTGRNLTKARKKRRDADERALALGRYTAELQDQIRVLKDEQERIVEEYEERCGGYSRDLHIAKEARAEQIAKLLEQHDVDVKKIQDLTRQRESLARQRDEIITKNKELIDELTKLKCPEPLIEPLQPLGVDWGIEMWSPNVGEDEELTIDILLGQALGAASMCWKSTPTGVFWSEKAEWILNGLKWHLKHNVSTRVHGPVKPVEALVKEQDTDAQLWALAFCDHFDMPNEQDEVVMGWFANAMQTAIDKWRNDHRELEKIGMRECNNDTFDPESEVPYPLSIETPQEYHDRLHKWMQGMVEHIKAEAREAITPSFADHFAKAYDAMAPKVEKVRANLAPNPSYPGWQASGHQTKEEWSVAQNLAGCDDSGAYEFVNAPKHYNDHPSGVECQVIIRECKDPLIAFAFKHLWRTQWGGKPGQTVDQDLGKAIEYIQLEQARRAGKDRL